MIGIIGIFVLIAISAYFTATEFAIVKIRSSRVDQLIVEGKPGSLAVKEVVEHLDEYLSVCQFGITITSLGIGWLGEPAVHHLLYPLFSYWNLPESIASGISLFFSFAIITFIHVVIGELAPKTWAIQRAERVSLLFARPLIYFYKCVYPFVWLLNKASQVVTRAFGLKNVNAHETAHSEEELRLILSQSYERGEINKLEYDYVENIFEFDNLMAKEIMVPRTEVVGLYAEDTVADAIRVVNVEQYTRYPIFSEDKDHVVGVINIKDLFIDYMNDTSNKETKVSKYVREIVMAIETIPVRDLFNMMQKKRSNLAVLYDEYGGTAGIITFEDILEEIVGEIQDEYDEDEYPDVQKTNDGHYSIDGKVLLSRVNDLLEINITADKVDTIGGWVFKREKELDYGTKIIHSGYLFSVILRRNHQIKRVEIKKISGEDVELE